MSEGHDIFDHEAALETIPAKPGCYLMKDHAGEIVYVGKAVDLKSRVRSYFSGGDPRPFVPHLPSILSTIDVVLTRNDKEAIILENTLIKRHKPRFNFMLRDDKEFLQLRIDESEPWPWVRIVRRRKKDGAKYFGPYHSASACRQTLRVLNRYFHLRTCRDSVLNNRSRPCLQYQIKRCPGPCVLDVDRDHYMENVKEAILFLKGRRTELVKHLECKMLQASDKREFEVAARLRDQIKAVDKVLERQQVVQKGFVDQDVYGLYREGARISVQILYVRNGRLQGGDLYHFEDKVSEDGEVLSQLMMQHYGHGAFVPTEVLLPTSIESHDAFEELLSEVRERRVYIKVPQRGPRKRLIENAQRNAEHQFEQHHLFEDKVDDILGGLRDKLTLDRMPRRIECFDISNLQGGAIVGSMVVFVDGQPSKKDYRTYKVRDIEGQDDFAAMYEVVTRRYRRVAEDEDDSEPVPDLVLVDGGKGQLGAALQAVQDLGVEDRFNLASIAKSRTLDKGSRGNEVFHSPERIFRPGRPDPIVLAQNSNEIFLLAQLRDEAHRKAVGYHRNVRKKRTLRSQLDDVPGVGPKRKAALLRHLGSLAKIRAASLEELLEVPGMNRPAAEKLREHFRKPRQLSGD